MSQAPAATEGKKTLSNTMHVKIYAPFKIYYDDQATSVTALNRVGPFDVLPNHHSFISLLEPGEIIVRNEAKPDFKMNITRGVIHVKADEIKVFLDV
jgi:F0F1-type ATP synthase epsilon subunit